MDERHVNMNGYRQIDVLTDGQQRFHLHLDSPSSSNATKGRRPLFAPSSPVKTSFESPFPTFPTKKNGLSAPRIIASAFQKDNMYRKKSQIIVAKLPAAEYPVNTYQTSHGLTQSQQPDLRINIHAGQPQIHSTGIPSFCDFESDAPMQAQKANVLNGQDSQGDVAARNLATSLAMVKGMYVKPTPPIQHKPRMGQALGKSLRGASTSGSDEQKCCTRPEWCVTGEIFHHSPETQHVPPLSRSQTTSVANMAPYNQPFEKSERYVSNPCGGLDHDSPELFLAVEEMPNFAKTRNAASSPQTLHVTAFGHLLPTNTHSTSAHTQRGHQMNHAVALPIARRQRQSELEGCSDVEYNHMHDRHLEIHRQRRSPVNEQTHKINGGHVFLKTGSSMTNHGLIPVMENIKHSNTEQNKVAQYKILSDADRGLFKPFAVMAKQGQPTGHALAELGRNKVGDSIVHGPDSSFESVDQHQTQWSTTQNWTPAVRSHDRRHAPVGVNISSHQSSDLLNTSHDQSLVCNGSASSKSVDPGYLLTLPPRAQENVTYPDNSNFEKPHDYQHLTGLTTKYSCRPATATHSLNQSHPLERTLRSAECYHSTRPPPSRPYTETDVLMENDVDPLPHHPVPVRAGLVHTTPRPQRTRPAPHRQYSGNDDQNTVLFNQREALRKRQEVASGLQEEISILRKSAMAHSSDYSLQMLLVMKLVEAASLPVIEDGTADHKMNAGTQEGYITDACEIIKSLVNNNHTEAMFFLADCYGSKALGFEKTPRKAFSLYLAAAKAGHPQSAYRTAVCCEIGSEDGGGTRKDLQKACQWYRRAAELGDVPGMYKLGMILLEGLLGQQKNFDEALRWLRHAAERADRVNPHALHQLGLLYEPHNTMLDRNNGILIHNDTRALELFTRAAKLGYKFSQFRVGQAYEYGMLGCPIDARESIIWYTQAAAQGEHEAELALSGWYLTGSEGILEHSDAEAYLWARKAALSEPPLPKAMFAMGYFTEVGIGCPKSLDEAKRWYGRAASYHFPKALERLDELKKGGSRAQKNSIPKLGRRDQKMDEANCALM